MAKQMIISVGREYGCGGKEIGKMLAEHYGINFYDSNLLQEVALDKNMDAAILAKYDEVPRNIFMSRTVHGFSNSIEVNIANMQFDYLKKKAAEGESFVIVGRCAETILKDCDALVSIFVLGDREDKIQRTIKGLGVSRSDAEDLLKTNDKKRKTYHNFYCEGKWGDSRNYDLSINTSKLGVEKSCEVVKKFIDEKFA